MSGSFSKIQLTIWNDSSSELRLDAGLLRGLDDEDKAAMKGRYDEIAAGQTVVIPLNKDRTIPINIRYGTAKTELGQWSAGTFKVDIDKDGASVSTLVDAAVSALLYAFAWMGWVAAAAVAARAGVAPPPTPPPFDEFEDKNSLEAMIDYDWVSNDTLTVTVHVMDAAT